MAGKSNRREFLRGQSALQAFGDLILSALPSAEPEGPRRRAAAGKQPSDSPDHYLLHVGRRAMACEFQIFFNAGQYPRATEVALEVLDLVEKLEDELTFFRDTSRLSRINHNAARRAVDVDPGLFEILDLALRLHAETGGAFDITATPLWEVWGFARRAGAVPDADLLADAQSRVGSQWVELDRQRRTVRFLKPGIRLNLGSIGKGYALDRCAEHLRSAGIEHFLIHGGSSSVLACGAQGSTGEGSPGGTPGSWIVGLPHPLRPERRLGELRLRDRSLGTSGSQAQSFWHQGRRYGHILDPRTGWPAQNVLTATAIASSAMLSDALSTAFYVMEPQQVLDYCRTRPELAAIVICPARRHGGFEVRSIGLGEGELVAIPAGGDARGGEREKERGGDTLNRP
jgi:thiamine biosynthesis lipoprotein